MPKPIRSDLWWAGWVSGGLAAFAVLEARGLLAYPDPRHTLTAVTRKWLGVYPEKPRRPVSAMGAIGLLSMFAAHMLMDPPVQRRWADDPALAGESSEGYADAA